MRSWPLIAAGGAGGLVLLAALYLRNLPQPGRGSGGRADPRSWTERPAELTTPRRPKHVPEGSPGESDRDREEDDHRNKPIPGTERWHYEEYLRLAAADPNAFDRLADAKTNSDAPLQDRIALLRAAWKVRGKEALHWYANAFAEADRATDEAPDALRGFVVRHLAAQAQAVPEAREFLRDTVFLDGSARAGDRSVAGRVVLRTADPTEISTLLATILGISDPAAAQGALIGLGLNRHAEAATALAWLSSHHPQESVRDRATEISRLRRAGQVGSVEAD